MCCEWKQPSPAELLSWILCRRSSRKKFTFSSQESLKAPQRKPHKPDSVFFWGFNANLKVPLISECQSCCTNSTDTSRSLRFGGFPLDVALCWTRELNVQKVLSETRTGRRSLRGSAVEMCHSSWEKLSVSVSVVMTVTALDITSNIQKHAEESKTTFYWSSLRAWSRKSGLTSLSGV